MSDQFTDADLATPEDIQSLMSRFGKARWIQAAVVTDNPFSILWSRKGQRQMAKLHGMMLELRGLPKGGILAKLAIYWWWFRFVVTSAELHRPSLSVRERWALVGIADTVELGPDGLPTLEYKINFGGSALRGALNNEQGKRSGIDPK